MHCPHDDVRSLIAKKYEILGELELAKNAILREMSGVDKCTLDKLRFILSEYSKTEERINKKLYEMEVKLNTIGGVGGVSMGLLYNEAAQQIVYSGVTADKLPTPSGFEFVFDEASETLILKEVV